MSGGICIFEWRILKILFFRKICSKQIIKQIEIETEIENCCILCDFYFVCQKKIFQNNGILPILIDFCDYLSNKIDFHSNKKKTIHINQ